MSSSLSWSCDSLTVAASRLVGIEIALIRERASAAVLSSPLFRYKIEKCSPIVVTAGVMLCCFVAGRLILMVGGRC